MATHSSILAWEIQWTEEPGGLHPWGQRSWALATKPPSPEQYEPLGKNQITRNQET